MLCSHMMFLLGEELRPDEVGRMFAECKKWCQPIESRTTTLRDQEQHDNVNDQGFQVSPCFIQRSKLLK